MNTYDQVFYGLSYDLKGVMELEIVFCIYCTDVSDVSDTDVLCTYVSSW